MTPAPSNPLIKFAKPQLAPLLAGAALASAALGLWLWLSEGDALIGMAFLAVAAFDVALLIAGLVAKRREERKREDSGIIEPMENRPPT